MKMTRMFFGMAVVLCAVAWACTNNAGARPTTHAQSSTSSADRIVLVTGTVTTAAGETLTVQTPQHGPGLSHDGRIHPMFIVAGRTIKLSTVGLLVYSSDGQIVHGSGPQVGDMVCVAGTFSAITPRSPVPTFHSLAITILGVPSVR